MIGRVAPVLVAVLVLALWDGAVRLFGIPPYVLPAPGIVLTEGLANGADLARATLVTGSASLMAFGVSLLLGATIAFAFASSRTIARSLWPYAIFLQTVPIIAIAPLVVIWSGPGFRTVVLVATIVSIFPIITTTTTGLTAVDRDLADLFRVHDATRWQTLWKLRLPHAVPYLVAGAQTAGGLAVVGAIAGEVFAGYGASAQGLGYLILVTSGQLKTAYLFAAVLACTLLGLVAFGTLSLVGMLVGRRFGSDA